MGAGVRDREPRKFTYDRVFGEDAGNALGQLNQLVEGMGDESSDADVAGAVACGLGDLMPAAPVVTADYVFNESHRLEMENLPRHV